MNLERVHWIEPDKVLLKIVAISTASISLLATSFLLILDKLTLETNNQVYALLYYTWPIYGGAYLAYYFYSLSKIEIGVEHNYVYLRKKDKISYRYPIDHLVSIANGIVLDRLFILTKIGDKYYCYSQHKLEQMLLSRLGKEFRPSTFTIVSNLILKGNFFVWFNLIWFGMGAVIYVIY